MFVFYICIYKKRDKISLYVCLTKQINSFFFQMFGFPTDIFGIPGSNNHRMTSNALVPHHQSLFGNTMMMPAPFMSSPFNGLFNDFGINSSPFGMMDGMMRQSNNNSNAPMHSFTSTTVMSYSGTDGRPKVYQESTSHSRGPGGIEETRQAVRDSERGINKVNYL
jgi:hypothetical protein